MPDVPVARGDRRQDLWIEKDARQLTKVRHTWPDDTPPGEGMDCPNPEVSEALAKATDATTMPDETSAWEALEKDD